MGMLAVSRLQQDERRSTEYGVMSRGGVVKRRIGKAVITATSVSSHTWHGVEKALGPSVADRLFPLNLQASTSNSVTYRIDGDDDELTVAYRPMPSVRSNIL